MICEAPRDNTRARGYHRHGLAKHQSDNVAQFGAHLSRMHALCSTHEVLLHFVTVGIPESDLGKRCTTASIVNDVCDDSLDVTVTLCGIKTPEASLSLPVGGVGPEDRPTTLTLCSNYAPHLQKTR